MLSRLEIHALLTERLECIENVRDHLPRKEGERIARKTAAELADILNAFSQPSRKFPPHYAHYFGTTGRVSHLLQEDATPEEEYSALAKKLGEQIDEILENLGTTDTSTRWGNVGVVLFVVMAARSVCLAMATRSEHDLYDAIALLSIADLGNNANLEYAREVFDSPRAEAALAGTALSWRLPTENGNHPTDDEDQIGRPDNEEAAEASADAVLSSLPSFRTYSDHIDRIESHLERLQRQTSKLAEDVVDSGIKLRKTLNSHADDASEKITTSFRDDCQQLRDEVTLAIEQLQSDCKSKLDAHSDAYVLSQAVKSPVDYWRQRHKNHWWAHVGWLLVTLAIGITTGACILFGVLLPSLEQSRLVDLPTSSAEFTEPHPARDLGDAKEDEPTDQSPISTKPAIDLAESQKSRAKQGIEWGRVNPWSLGSAAFLSTLVLLVLRMTTRLTLSNLHMATDAKERETMMKAYLAMLEAEQLSDQGHRELILNALFRPSTTGLIKEEAVPPSMFDLVARAATAGKS